MNKQNRLYICLQIWD